MKQTAVEWLFKNIWTNPPEDLLEILDKAKKMEDKQKNKFSIDFYNWCKSESTENLLHDLIIVGEIDKNVTIQKMLEIFKKKIIYEKHTHITNRQTK